MPPEKHALLSASSASRWLKCTAAPRFEEHLPERTSEYAEEGRLAHAICELKTLKKFTVMTSRTYTTRLNKLKKNPLYSEEMDKTSDLYIEHLIEQAMLYDSTPTVVAEVQVDFGEYVPEGFGTCDNVMIGGDTLSITDYKHGKGVPVSAVGNPQMRLYALGALKRYGKLCKNFKLVKHSGVYWKGDANNHVMQRIYGVCFPTAEELIRIGGCGGRGGAACKHQRGGGQSL